MAGIAEGACKCVVCVVDCFDVWRHGLLFFSVSCCSGMVLASGQCSALVGPHAVHYCSQEDEVK